MLKIRSLTNKLLVYLLLSQAVAFLVTWVAIQILIAIGAAFVFDFQKDDFAYFEASDLVVQSLVKESDGKLVIAPSPSLQALADEIPTFRYAAIAPEDSRALPGSSPELVDALSDMGKVRSRYMEFSIDGGSRSSLRGIKEKQRTPFGLLYIVVYGYQFRPASLFYFLKDELIRPGTFFLGMFFASVAAAWISIRQGLKPLNVIARQAARIDLDSLGQSIVAAHVSKEVEPLIDSINGALRRLDASTTRMRRFIANAAHELRTPVAIMRARLENTREPTFDNDLLRDVSHLQSLVEQLLIASRIAERQSELEQDLDLGETIWQVVADYMPLVAAGGRKIELESGDSVVRVRGNERAIQCVVANLLDNALRAEPLGGTVRVRVEDDGIVEIADHGEGIAAEDMEKIFEPFWRKSERTPGTGLGLAIARELIGKLGGRIWVEHTPGGGATFKVRFPVQV
ncbi:HAMP domain-containing sensor histidine kinase [Methylocystis sp. ATCC 49242]|uniref:sensor histidine kinase n=1 Tax=Methylocystis sp. ATCC 49242 TaxID=622637 RepID=UPI0001F86ADC|nr:HAMP domain-containing sensor histidine kinase [Methylocystis sp. ATCC 49242]